MAKVFIFHIPYFSCSKYDSSQSFRHVFFMPEVNVKQVKHWIIRMFSSEKKAVCQWLQHVKVFFIIILMNKT